MNKNLMADTRASSDADQQCSEVPLVEQLRSIPKDYRTSRAIQWSDDGRETGHQFIPVGFMMHRAADLIESLQSASAAPSSSESDDALPIHEQIPFCWYRVVREITDEYVTVYSEDENCPGLGWKPLYEPPVSRQQNNAVEPAGREKSALSGRTGENGLSVLPDGDAAKRRAGGSSPSVESAEVLPVSAAPSSPTDKNG